MDTSLLTKSAVAERPGGSVALITRLPGEPDLRKQVCGRNHPLARYALARVEEAEASASFCEWQASLSKRKAAARKSVATKEAKLLEAIRTRICAVMAQAYPALPEEGARPRAERT